MMRGRYWTPQELGRAADLIRIGVPMAQVAAALGRTRNAVVLALSAAGTPYWHLREQLQHMAVDLVRSGKDPNEVAAAFGLRRRLLTRWLSKAGIPRMHGRPRRLAEPAHRKVAIRHLNGETYISIARDLGVPMSTIRAAVKRYRCWVGLPQLVDERTLEGRAARRSRCRP